METPRYYSPDISSIHMELGGLDNSTGTIDVDEGYFLGGLGTLPWGLDNPQDGFNYNLDQEILHNRPVKKRRLQDPTEPPNPIPGAVPVTAPTSLAHSLATLPSQIPPVYDLTTPPPGTRDLLISQVLEIFPDISHGYVEELINRFRALDHQGEHGEVDIGHTVTKDAIIEEILENPSYPKQEKTKRKNGDDHYDDDSGWTPDTPYHGNPLSYSQIATQILAKEFPTVPMQHIRQVMCDMKRLYKAYLTIFSQASRLLQGGRPFEKLKTKRNSTGPDPITSNDANLPFIGDLKRELKAARKQVAKDSTALRKRKQQEEAEQRNEEEHMLAGNVMECQCCYLDAPLNRSIPCEGSSVHFFCYTCIRKYAETQIGLMGYNLQCFDVSGCQARFSRGQLKDALGPSLLEKLDSLQQQDEIQKACLDGLEDCPFCQFKAVCPPVGEDREFRCSNPECGVVSCRLCNERSHTPLTCLEARKEKGLSERHEVEEAMSKALIRNCPKCSVKIIKEFGCNKMTCPKCQCMMCYLCKKDITREKYKHFGRGPNFCAQDDSSMEDRYQREVREAEKVTISKILAENPGLTEEELRVRHPEVISNNSGSLRVPPIIPNFVLPGGGAHIIRPPPQAQRFHPLQQPHIRGLQTQYMAQNRTNFNFNFNQNMPDLQNGAVRQPFADLPPYNHDGLFAPFDFVTITGPVTVQDNAPQIFAQNIQPQGFVADNIPQFPFTQRAAAPLPYFPPHQRDPDPPTQFGVFYP